MQVHISEGSVYGRFMGSDHARILKSKWDRPENRRFKGLCRTFRHQKERHRIPSFFHIALFGPEKSDTGTVSGQNK